jgi:hypothetical protein
MKISNIFAYVNALQGRSAVFLWHVYKLEKNDPPKKRYRVLTEILKDAKNDKITIRKPKN